MSKSDQNSYRQIMKATSIFGGVQVINIIIAIVRSKAVAVLLGPVGMGISGLLTSAVSLVSSATNFGLATSAVKDMSAAYAADNKKRLAETSAVFTKLLWITGCLGLLTMFLFSPWISQITFGNKDYTLEIAALSVVLLINQLAGGKLVILQSMRKLKWLAKANIWASFASLMVALPMFYFWGNNGIAPSIIASALLTYVIQHYFASKVAIPRMKVNWRSAYGEGKEMLHLGFMISLSGFITVAVSYITRIFISNTGGLADVGLYNAGFTIVSTYVGMVFTAMGTDYYPRLSAISNDPGAYNTAVNQQAETAILILSPLICALLIFVKILVKVLYSQEFLSAIPLIHWALLGIFFKAFSWALGFMLLAKGDSKAFFWNELLANLYILVCNVGGYYLAGLSGLGIGFLVAYVIYFVQVWWFTRKFYNVVVKKELIINFLFFLVLGIMSFLIAANLEGFFLYLTGSIVIIVTILMSLRQLNLKMDLKTIIKNRSRKS